MPTIETVEKFISRVEENDHDNVIEEFYIETASMQENQDNPRVGRKLLIANERKVLAKSESVTSKCIKPFFINGDYVIIRWVFNFTWKDGTKTQIEEIAYQRWESQKIAEETFFYDPIQRIPK
ncbi:nuclear transport factor 2 family protein [Leptospira vanthielii]|uniref:Nuclear transport factor 2 family protein n=1 Tax=Leptospira vanthielii TaxID=293085 RepID=A0ABY2NU02_9LEPT|nr:nuclear transport factor 2 family protein [Leptospira vanthielii]TGM61753.1 nuclear transport factor 2 family protein [Leptospira vanthielii]